MTDTMTAEQRHRCMSHIRSRDTKPELKVRRWLWHHGYRYRLNVKSVPGKPDIVMRPYRTAIFVNGCFWHGHNVALPQMSDGRCKMEDIIENSECCKIPKTNRDFWVSKIRRNKERDREEQRQLAQMGWHCITVWECELKPSKREETLESIAFTLNHIFLQDRRCKMADENSKEYHQEESENYLKAAEEKM